MTSELFNTLETKLDTLIEEVETLRLEISELRQVRDDLQQQQSVAESNLQRLLGKFDRLADSVDI